MLPRWINDEIIASSRHPRMYADNRLATANAAMSAYGSTVGIDFMPVTAKRSLYIKLGEGNRWAQLSFDSNTLRFGFGGISHQMALAAAQAGNFKPIKDFYEVERSVPSGTATRYSNEVREFYTAGSDVLLDHFR